MACPGGGNAAPGGDGERAGGTHPHQGGGGKGNAPPQQRAIRYLLPAGVRAPAAHLAGEFGAVCAGANCHRGSIGGLSDEQHVGGSGGDRVPGLGGQRGGVHLPGAGQGRQIYWEEGALLGQHPGSLLHPVDNWHAKRVRL
jgi:hypothetical protein